MANRKSIFPARGPGAFAFRMALAAVVGLLGGIGSQIFGDMPGLLGLGLTLLNNGIAMGAALVICVLWWRGIDEAAQEAHKWAWWWGGCSGMAFGGVLLLTALAREQERIDDFSANELLAIGMFLMMTCMIIGYGVAWAAWWAKRQ